jgi:hypothetical protein
MSRELVPRIPDEKTPKRPSQAARRRAREAVVDYRMAPVKFEEPVTLSRHVMEKVVELDAKRRELTGNDAGLNALPADVQLDVIRTMRTRHPHRFLDDDCRI